MTDDKRGPAAQTRPGGAAWIFLAVVALAFAIGVWIAPNERSLGAGIKTVYVHVALTWTGMLGFAVSGLIGLVLAISAQPSLHAWMKSVGWVALPFYATGAVMSIVAAQVNWGGVLWSEPRMTATTLGLAGAIVLVVVNNWLPWRRVQGLFSFGFAVLLVASIRNATLFFHPANPIGASFSTGIQSAFIGLFVLSCIAAMWSVWYVRRRVHGR